MPDISITVQGGLRAINRQLQEIRRREKFAARNAANHVAFSLVGSRRNSRVGARFQRLWNSVFRPAVPTFPGSLIRVVQRATTEKPIARVDMAAFSRFSPDRSRPDAAWRIVRDQIRGGTRTFAGRGKFIPKPGTRQTFALTRSGRRSRSVRANRALQAFDVRLKKDGKWYVFQKVGGRLVLLGWRRTRITIKARYNVGTIIRKLPREFSRRYQLELQKELREARRRGRLL